MYAPQLLLIPILASELTRHPGGLLDFITWKWQAHPTSTVSQKYMAQANSSPASNSASAS